MLVCGWPCAFPCESNDELLTVNINLNLKISLIKYYLFINELTMPGWPSIRLVYHWCFILCESSYQYMHKVDNINPSMKWAR